jgi:hypothetical protein
MKIRIFNKTTREEFLLEEVSEFEIGNDNFVKGKKRFDWIFKEGTWGYMYIPNKERFSVEIEG